MPKRRSLLQRIPTLLYPRPRRTFTEVWRPHLRLGFVRLYCLYGLLLLLPQTAWAQRTGTYQDAVNAFEYGNYGEAIQRFSTLLKGKSLTFKQRQEAHKHLGLAYFYRWRNTSKRSFREKADNEFESFLLLHPAAQLDPALYPPRLVSFFNRIRKRMAPQLRKLLAQRKRQKQAQRTRVQVVKLRINRRTYVSNPIINLVPFGVPQYLNGQPLKASLLLAGEMLALGTNITAYQVIASNQIQNGPQIGRFPRESVDTIRAWQRVQFISIGLFAGLLIYGAVDGFWNFRRQREVPVPEVPPNLDPGRFSQQVPYISSGASQNGVDFSLEKQF